VLFRKNFTGRKGKPPVVNTKKCWGGDEWSRYGVHGKGTNKSRRAKGQGRHKKRCLGKGTVSRRKKWGLTIFSNSRKKRIQIDSKKKKEGEGGIKALERG